LQPEKIHMLITERGVEQRSEGQHGDSTRREEVRHFFQKCPGVIDVLERVERQQHIVFFLGKPTVQIPANESRPLSCTCPLAWAMALSIYRGRKSTPVICLIPSLANAMVNSPETAAHVQVAQVGLDGKMALEAVDKLAELRYRRFERIDRRVAEE